MCSNNANVYTRSKHKQNTCIISTINNCYHRTDIDHASAANRRIIISDRVVDPLMLARRCVPRVARLAYPVPVD